jgi:hypothetical protein
MTRGARLGVRTHRWSSHDQNLLLRLRQNNETASWKAIGRLFAASSPHRVRRTNALKIRYGKLMKNPTPSEPITARPDPINPTTGLRPILSKDPVHGLGLFVPSTAHIHCERIAMRRSYYCDAEENCSLSPATCFGSRCLVKGDANSNNVPLLYPSELIQSSPYPGGSRIDNCSERSTLLYTSDARYSLGCATT